MAKINLSAAPKLINENELVLFGSAQPPQQLKETIVKLPLGALTPWQDKTGRTQPFRPYGDQKLAQLAEDIGINGVLSPIIVRPYGAGRYQILAGHNRCAASRMAGLDEIPAIIREVDDDTATLIMVNTNLNQRDEMLPSERAWAYRLQLEAMKRQGARTDLTSTQLGQKSKLSVEVVAEQAGSSRNQIQRYIRLTYLIPDLLEMVDKGMLPMVSGVALSYLTDEQQQIVCDISIECEKQISSAQAEQLRRLDSAAFSAAAVRDILLPQKSYNAVNELISRSRKLIPKSATSEDIDAIAELIERYFSQLLSH